MTLRRLLCLATLCASLTGCATFPSLSAPSQPKMLAQWHQTEEIQPIELVGKDGKTYVANHVTRTYDAGKESTGVKQPFFQRIWGWFLSLGIFGGILAFFFPTAFFAILLWLMNKWKKLKEQYFAHKDALEATVKAIEETKALDTNLALKAALAKHQDENDKKLIATMRATS